MTGPTGVRHWPSDGNGYWSANVAQARPGDEYKYVLHNGAQILLRSDPYARIVSGEFRNSVILEDDARFPIPAVAQGLSGTWQR